MKPTRASAEFARQNAEPSACKRRSGSVRAAGSMGVRGLNAPQDLEKSDTVLQHGETRLHQRLLGAEQTALGVQDLELVGHALA